MGWCGLTFLRIIYRPSLPFKINRLACRPTLAEQADECLTNNAVYGDFRIVGAGRETRAVNEKTQEVFFCKVHSLVLFLSVYIFS